MPLEMSNMVTEELSMDTLWDWPYLSSDKLMHHLSWGKTI